jgi:protein phosphatase
VKPTLNGAGRTDVGLKREFNEDAYAINLDAGLLALADGMGGHAAGEVASRLAIDTVAEFVSRTAVQSDITWPFGYDDRLSAAGNRLRAAFRLANERIFHSIEENEELRGMGTTLVAALAVDATCAIAHVGDSRAYLLREGKLTQVTNDHSWVNEQVLLGLLTREEAARHPFRNVITRALGSREDVTADVNEIRLVTGDVLLLCSDGLTSMVEDGQILKAMAAHATDPEGAAGELVERANRAGGDDNTTVIVAAFRG